MNMHVKPPKFKAGDTVRVVDEAGGHGLLLGATAKVTSVRERRGGADDMISLEGGRGAYARRFELVAPKAKVGDKVLAKASIIDITEGREYEVVDIDDNDSVVVLDNVGDRWHMRDGEYDIVEVKELRVGTRLRYKGASNRYFTRGETYYCIRTDDDDRYWIRAAGAELAAAAASYKVGDFVRATVNGIDLTKGAVYKVDSIPSDVDYPVGIRDDANDAHNLTAAMFEKFEFRVGDRVKFVNGIDGNSAFLGKTGVLVRKEYEGDWIVKLDERHAEGHRCCGALPGGFGRYASSDGLEPLTGKAKPAEVKPAEVTPTTGRAIVCKMDGDTPLPATRPFVHNSGSLALREARRLAELHGGTFGVYVLADAVKYTAPTYDHEWQRLAKAGAKIDAIKELRARTGLTLKGAKDAVEHWLSI